MNDALATQAAGIEPFALSAVGHVAAEAAAAELAPALPSDHPPWQRDVVSLSARARATIAALRPVIVRVLSFWDHRVRDITLGTRRFGIDASGCYRLR